MAFDRDDLFDAMVSEICRGRRHQFDQENKCTRDDSLRLIAPNRSQAFRKTKLPSRRNIQRSLDVLSRRREQQYELEAFDFLRELEAEMNAPASEAVVGRPKVEGTYYERHREEQKSRARQYYQEFGKAKQREYYESNRDKKIAAAKERYHRRMADEKTREEYNRNRRLNPSRRDRSLEYKKYYLRHPEAQRLKNLKNSIRQRALRNFLKGSLCCNDCKTGFFYFLSIIEELEAGRIRTCYSVPDVIPNSNAQRRTESATSTN